jgi:hypothetical protein
MATSPLGTARIDHQTVLVPSAGGRVLAVGGWNPADGYLASAELYTSTQMLQRQSNSVQDGWVLESGENTNKGVLFSTRSPRFALGDDGGNKQFRSILSFNTAALPDQAVITRVVLKIKKEGVEGTNPFTTHGKIAIDIRRGAFSNSADLQSTDFEAWSNRPGVGVFVDTPQPGGWYLARLNPVAYPFVNRTGITQLRLRFQRQDDDDELRDILSFYSGNAATPADRPVLLIEYYVP